MKPGGFNYMGFKPFQPAPPYLVAHGQLRDFLAHGGDDTSQLMAGGEGVLRDAQVVQHEAHVAVACGVR